MDLEFDLSYLLSDKLGVKVAVVKAGYDESTGDLCVEAEVGGSRRYGCVAVRACRGVPEAKRARCILRVLQEREELLDKLASSLKA